MLYSHTQAKKENVFKRFSDRSM